MYVYTCTNVGRSPGECSLHAYVCMYICVHSIHMLTLGRPQSHVLPSQAYGQCATIFCRNRRALMAWIRW